MRRGGPRFAERGATRRVEAKSGCHEMIKYQEKDGRLMFVARSFDGNYGTFREKKTGSLQRVKSPEMPMTESICQAERNLASYASKHGLEPFQEYQP